MQLSIFIDEKWGRQDAQTPLSWVLHDLDGEQRNAGQQPLADLPAAATCQIIAAASAVFLTQVPLPTRQTQKLRQLLPYAVEEKLMCDPERVHVALGPIDEKGRADVAVVDREWMQAILERFRLAGRKPQAMWVETLLPPWRHGDWTVVWNGREGFVRTGPAAGFLLDGGAAEAVPQALQLALPAGEGQRPERLLFYAAQPKAMPDLRLWEAQLGMPLQAAGAWTWAEGCQGGGIDLLQGDFAVSQAGEWARLCKPTLVLLAAIVALQGGASLVDYGRLKLEQVRLQRQMTSIFRKTFPQVTTIADAPAQMKQNLELLRQRAGEPDARDFLALMDQAGVVFANMGTIDVQRMQYEWGKLRFQTPVPDRQTAELVRSRLATEAIQSHLDYQAGADGTGMATFTMSIKK